jgi:hypothetical protein
MFRPMMRMLLKQLNPVKSRASLDSTLRPAAYPVLIRLLRKRLPGVNSWSPETTV